MDGANSKIQIAGALAPAKRKITGEYGLHCSEPSYEISEYEWQRYPEPLGNPN